MNKDLQVGIIGVNATRGWAREAHVPAVLHVPGLALAAVATRHQSSADAAARAVGAPRAYGDPRALIADPAIDVVTVASAVPGHRDLIVAALRADKHVYTEWPVGTDAAQTLEAQAAVEGSGLVVAVGLQARGNPAAAEARNRVRRGDLGRVLAISVYSTTAGFGPTVPAHELYLEEPETGMNLLTIQTAHTLDLALWIAGDLASLSAMTTIQYPTPTVSNRTETARRVLPDHVAVQGRLHDGGALTAEIVGGRPAGRTPFRLQVLGERGTLELIGGAARGFQSASLTVMVDGEQVHVDPGALAGLDTSAMNVAGIYAALRDDVLGTTAERPPSIEDGVHLARLLDDLRRSADQGAVVQPVPRPRDAPATGS